MLSMNRFRGFVAALAMACCVFATLGLSGCAKDCKMCDDRQACCSDGKCAGCQAKAAEGAGATEKPAEKPAG